MAIVQISQITNRKGLAADLPQLSGGELGWSTDTRQLWIGNGTLAEGAPVVGNTEILTEFSDILALSNSYTYKGQAAGYTVQTGVNPDAPSTLSLQSWLDQFASVLDFGAVGDGVTDDTAAINNALYQLFCREVNPQIRRSLFFPAGVYRVTGSIAIPPYATLYGEGNASSVIAMDAGVNDYVAQTADNQQQTGINIGDAGAVPPQNINIMNMGFTHLDPTGSPFLVQTATVVSFTNVGFRGASTLSQLTSDTNGSIGVSFGSTNSLVCEQITFTECVFSNLVWASYTDRQVKGVTFSQSQLNNLYTGFEFGTGTLTNGGPTGVRILNNVFDNIYAQGIIFGDISLNASGYNIFYDVGNYFQGTTNPSTTIIEIQNANNISIADMFQRSDSQATTVARINLNKTSSIATTNGELLTIGRYNRNTGGQATLINGSNGTVLTFNTSLSPAVTIDYTITRQVGNNLGVRTGSIKAVQPLGNASPVFTDTMVQNANTGITLNVSGNTSILYLDYVASNASVNGTIVYSISYLD